LVEAKSWRGGLVTDRFRIACARSDIERDTSRKRPAALVALVALALAATAAFAADGQPPAELAAGWKTDFSRHAVPFSQFQPGGPGKDGIPALDGPRFAPVAKTTYLKPREPVIAFHGRAYPLQILIWHEIVNDRVAGVPVAVTFCPLCNTAIVFDRRVGGRTLSFGTTGNLRFSDLVMYDRQTESWWQQFGGTGLVGRYAGAHLRQLAARIVSWEQFRTWYPHRGLVLTRNTGYPRPYGENPYTGYDNVANPPLFPVSHGDDKRLQPKERVVFVERAGNAAAVPFSVLAKKKTVSFQLAGHRLLVRLTGAAASALDGAVIADSRHVPTVDVREQGKLVPFDTPFWFAVAAFRPDVVIVR
jgi:hypothetical protein